jgi:hypothetical protein
MTEMNFAAEGAGTLALQVAMIDGTVIRDDCYLQIMAGTTAERQAWAHFQSIIRTSWAMRPLQLAPAQTGDFKADELANTYPDELTKAIGDRNANLERIGLLSRAAADNSGGAGKKAATGAAKEAIRQAEERSTL